MGLDARGYAVRFGLFSLLLFVALALTMYRTPFASLLLISVKLSLFVHLPGYLIALKVLREEYDPVALLFIVFGFGIILISLMAYFIGTLGQSISDYTYVMPISIIIAFAMLLIKK